MKTLQDVYQKYAHADYLQGSDKGTRHSYIEDYQRLFSPLQDKAVDLLEIGIASGNSLLLWEDYFTQARIIGMDILPAPEKLLTGHPRITCLLGDSTRPKIFASLRKYMFDIIIDDGAHNPASQLMTFCLLYPRYLKQGGLYIIEDVQRGDNAEYFKLFGEFTLGGRQQGDDRLIIFRKP